MPLVLEVPPETEFQLRQSAARAGRGVEEWIVEVALRQAAQIPLVALDEAAQILGVARGFLAESVDNGKLTGEKREGELFLLVDEKFEALRAQQRATQAALVEIARINAASGLYEN